MPVPDVVPSPPLSGEERRRQFTASLPMRTALLAVAAVWFLGAVWSYTEQSAFAANKGFSFPHLLPLVIDGFAIAMAGVAWAASLDARPAVAARLATVVAVFGSSASNGAWAWIRSDHDMTAVVLGVAVPIAANLAFEVLLAELRRQVQRRRGLPPPVAIPYPRLIRLALAPWRTFVEWRAMVLDLTAMEHTIAARPAPAPAGPAHPALPAPSPAPAAPTAPPAVPVASGPAVVEPATVPGRGFDPAAGANGSGESASGHNGSDRNVAGRNGSRRNGSGVTGDRHVSGTNGNGSHPTGSHTTGSHTTGSHATGSHTTGSDPTGDANGADRAVANRASTNQTSTNQTSANQTSANRTADNRTGANRGGSERRALDSRVEMLAAHLAATEDAGEFTGEMVGPLLGIDVAPRTGRRLLGQARELVAERARAETEHHDSGLRIIGAG